MTPPEKPAVEQLAELTGLNVLQECFRDGRAAYFRGDALDTCSLSYGPEMRASWLDGWHCALEEDEDRRAIEDSTMTIAEIVAERNQLEERTRELDEQLAQKALFSETELKSNGQDPT